MSGRKMRRHAAALALALVCTAAGAQSAPGVDDKARAKMGVEDIRQCMAGNFVGKGTLRDLRIVSTDEEGSSRTLLAKLYWLPQGEVSRMRLYVKAPSELAGSAYLMRSTPQDEEVHLYLPALKSVRKLSGSDSSAALWGTDFSFDDVRQLQGMIADGATERGTDGDVEGRRTFVLNTRPSGENSPFKRIVSHVDQQTCILLKTEFFEDGAQPRKLLQADLSSLLDADLYDRRVWMVFGYEMRDLRSGTRSEVTMGGIDLLWVELPKKAFEPEHFFERYETDG
jgi:hypothetical protein